MSKNGTHHTPGPWRIIGVDGFATAIWGPNAENVVGEGGPPMRQADACLIAAAPELLEALRAFVAWYPNHTSDSFPALGLARAAIAKAEGR